MSSEGKKKVIFEIWKDSDNLSSIHLFPFFIFFVNIHKQKEREMKDETQDYRKTAFYIVGREWGPP